VSHNPASASAAKARKEQRRDKKLIGGRGKVDHLSKIGKKIKVDRKDRKKKG
jgi:hypothetical protein